MANLLKKEIQKGVNLYLLPDEKYKTVSMSMFLHRKLSKDEATSNALISKVLKRGTQKYKTINELNLCAERMYGTLYDVNISKKAYVQSMVFSVNFLHDNYIESSIVKDVSEFMLDLAFKPYTDGDKFNADYVNVEKQNLKDDILGLVNDKRSYANFRCIEEMCEGEDTAVFEFGYIDDIDKLTPQGLYEHYKSIILKSPIDIFVVGKADIDTLAEIFQNYFKNFDFDITPINAPIIKPKDVGEVKNVEDKFDVNQGKLALGLRTGINIDNPKYYALSVANSIFGAGAHSRLFNTVREQMSLCYYASSIIDKFRSIMLISSGIEFENFEKCKTEILKQLDFIKQGDFTDDELKVAKDFMVNRYLSCMDSPFQMKDYYLGQCFCKNSDTIDEAAEKIKTVTRQEVIDAISGVSLDTVYFLKGKE